VGESNNEHNTNSGNDWFSEGSSNFWLVSAGGLILLGIFFVYITVYYFHLYSFDEKTDGLAVFVGLLTLVAAAITVWVSWLIKEEAKSIGDSIITNAVIHRHLDRMLHEYSIVMDRALDSLQTYFGLEERSSIYKISEEQMGIVKLSISFECWMWFHRFQGSGKSTKTDFFSYLMPGNVGHKFSHEIGFGELAKDIKKLSQYPKEVLEEYKERIKYQYELLELIDDADRCLWKSGLEEDARIFADDFIDPDENIERMCAEHEANEKRKYEELQSNKDYIDLDNAFEKIKEKEAELGKKSKGLLHDSYSQQNASPDNDVRFTDIGIKLATKEKFVKCTIKSLYESLSNDHKCTDVMKVGIAILNMMKKLGWKSDDYDLEHFLQDRYSGAEG